MRFLQKNFRTLAVLAFVLTMTFFGDALALDKNDIMTTARSKGIELFTNVKTIVFVIGGFGLIALAFGAIFGKVKWVFICQSCFWLGRFSRGRRHRRLRNRRHQKLIGQHRCFQRFIRKFGW